MDFLFVALSICQAWDLLNDVFYIYIYIKLNIGDRAYVNLCFNYLDTVNDAG